MYLVVSLVVDKELADVVEANIYEFAKFGWEFEEKDLRVVYKFYFPLSLNEAYNTILNSLLSLIERSSGTTAELSLLPKERWEEIWKYNFPPLKLGKRLLILPPWEEGVEEEGRIKVVIKPAQAFGTGHHATTQLMLEHLEEFLTEKEATSLRILDLGCGTGILAIASALLTRNGYILAVDLDELALSATQENAKINRVSERIRIAQEIPAEDWDLGFDLILANIGFRELVSLVPDLKRLSKTQGNTNLMLSGFLKEDSEKLIKHYLALGFRLLKSKGLNEWGFLWLQS